MVGAPGISATSTSPYLGTEIDISGSYRILSDLGISLNGGLFFPGIDPNGAFSASLSAKPVQFALQLALTLGM
ncbi:hypothetical protein A2Y27_03820 [candidate division CPR2 bacterium GWD1_39_7]|nr:MAG: hypothetical protein A2Y27_03820 [candidate division CPR2 bacterium GWD1_39_7]